MCICKDGRGFFFNHRAPAFVVARILYVSDVFERDSLRETSYVTDLFAAALAIRSSEKDRVHHTSLYEALEDRGNRCHICL